MTNDQIDEIIQAAQKAVWGHSVVISNGGTGWQRHVEEPLWALRKALRRAGIPEKNEDGSLHLSKAKF
jgi:hypothetical protein